METDRKKKSQKEILKVRKKVAKRKNNILALQAGAYKTTF